MVEVVKRINSIFKELIMSESNQVLRTIGSTALFHLPQVFKTNDSTKKLLPLEDYVAEVNRSLFDPARLRLISPRETGYLQVK